MPSTPEQVRRPSALYPANPACYRFPVAPAPPEAVLEAIRRLQPWLLQFSVAESIGLPEGFSPEYGLDLYVARRAATRGMPNIGLETVEDQLEAFGRAPLKEQGRDIWWGRKT